MSPTPATRTIPSLSIGPIPYYWPRADVVRFYAAVTPTAVARIYLGETVCSRRHELRAQDWLALARELATAGKQVVLSSQTLIESMADVKALENLAGNAEFTIEANDMSAVALLAGRTNFIAGPHLNLHSPDTLEWISGLGATRWVAPPDLTGAQIASLLAARPAGLETEVLVHGRLPLAFSARCFTARHFNLPKEDCQFRCIEHPDGLPLATREGAPFLTLNGIQTQSAAVQSLLAELPTLHGLGVNTLRISPQATRMDAVIGAYARALADPSAIPEIAADLGQWFPASLCNGYWHGEPGMSWVEATA
jgi:O2-independent ubiquinone biosynthesis protein UbiV